MMEKIRHHYFPLLFGILVVALPFSKAIASITEVLLLLLSLYFHITKFNKVEIGRARSILSPILIYAALLIGMLYTSDWATGLKVLNIQHSLLTIPVIVWLNRENVARNYARYLGLFVWSAAISGAVTVVLNMLNNQQLANLTAKIPFIEPFASETDRLAFGYYCPFHNKIQFANLLSVASIIAIFLLAEVKKRLFWIPLGILLLSAILTGGRGAQIGLLVGLGIWTLQKLITKVFPSLKGRIGAWQARIVLIGAFLFMGLGLPYLAYKTVPNVNKRYGQLMWEIGTIRDGTYKQYNYQEFTSLRRIVSLNNMWTLAKQHPLLGTGTGDYPAAIKQIYELDGFDLPVNNHSQYLYCWGAVGLVGLGLFFFAVVYWLQSLRPKQLAYGFGLALMGFYLVSMLPDAILLRQLDNMCFPLFMGIIACINQRNG